MNLVSVLRIVTLMEGTSYLLLVLIAMPLKYAFDYPMAVRIAGSVHGALFIAFVLALLSTHRRQNWTLGFSAPLFVGSLVPGTLFWMDRRIQRGADARSDEETDRSG